MKNKRAAGNIASYENLGWIISHSQEGFFALIASPRTQESVVSHYRCGAVEVYDYREHPGDYRFRDVALFLQEHPQARTVFLVNLQFALMKPEAVQRLNFSRDMLARENRNFIFCMTEHAFDTLNLHALDFFSFLKLKLRFSDEMGDTEDRMQIIQGPVLLPDRSVGVNPDEDYDPRWPRQRQLTFAIALVNQAAAMNMENRYADALKLLSRAVTLREEWLGENHPETASAYFAMGITYGRMGQYAEALKEIQKAVKIREEIGGPENPYTADTYNAMGGIHEALGQYEEALKCYRKDLEICERIMGPEHPDTATAYTDVADVYVDLRRYDDALMLYQKALIIRERVLGVGHPDTAATYNNMALAYAALFRYEEALRCYEKALEVRERVLGPSYPDTAITYNNMAGVYEALGRYEEAMNWLQKARRIMELVLGAKHPNTTAIYKNILILYQKMGKKEEADKWLQKISANTESAADSKE